MTDVLPHDLRYALRHLQRSWFFAAITVLTLGLGIGVVTALFAVVNAVLLHPIVSDQNRVVRIWKLNVARGDTRFPLTYVEFKAWREQSRSFEGLAAIQAADKSSTAITIDGQPTGVSLTPVSSNFFAVLHRGAPIAGRWLGDSDDLAGTDIAAVVSEHFWRRVGGADPAFVGRRFRLAGGDRSVLVVGVAPAAFDYPIGTDAWVPITRLFDGVGERLDVESHGFIHFELLGRLAPGTSHDQARAELAVVHQRFIAQFPDRYRPMEVVAVPLLDTVVGNSRQVLLFLFAAGALVFAIAGVNVAALLLMRAAGRRAEIAVRVALGASHARLARQTITEGLLLGVLGALGGVLVARVFLAVMQWMAPGDVPRIERAVLDGPVLVFCVVATLVWVLALGTVPIWFSASAREDRDRVHGTRGLRLFTIAEVAAAVVVAIGAGLLLRSFMHLQGIDRGFKTDNLAVLSILLPESSYPDAQKRLTFYEQLLASVTSIPGVISASPVHLRPGSGIVGLSASMIFDGQTPDEAATNPWGTWEPVMPSYFRTLGIPIVAGREFTAADSRDGAPVAIVSQAVAERYWPGQNPLSKRVQFISRFAPATVVGVAADMRYRELTRNWLTVYFPAAQFFFFGPGSLVVRTAGDPAPLVPAIRQTIQTQEPQAAVESIATMETLVEKELSRPRTAVTVTALFALMAIVLAAVGVYGVMSYEVRQRRRELAVRSALGASPADIFRGVVGRSLLLGALGIVAGLVVAAAVTRSLRTLLYEVAPSDPTSFAGGAIALLAIVLIASCVPASRAASADPIAALRTE